MKLNFDDDENEKITNSNITDNTTKTFPAIFGDEMDYEMLTTLSIYEDNYLTRKETSCCSRLIYIFTDALIFLIPYAQLIAFSNILIMTMITNIKINGNVTDSMITTLSTSLWLGIIFYFIHNLCLQSIKVVLHENYFSKVIICRSSNYHPLQILELLLYQIIIISTVVSMSQFEQDCVEKPEVCSYIWQLIHKIFPNNN